VRYPDRRARLAAIRRNPPPGWGVLFAPVPGGRSGKVRCLLCGATGNGWHGARATSVRGLGGRILAPYPWQAVHLLGHPVQCATCRRPFTGPGAVRSHQTCKLHHSCCGDHTTVPAWKNPFTRVA
jgi:hypothetical protein